MILLTNRQWVGTALLTVVGAIGSVSFSAVPASAKNLLQQRQDVRLSAENDAKLIEAVAAHLQGVAQLQRVIVEELDWKALGNIQRKHVMDAIKDFKSSQVLLSEALANTGLLVGRLQGEQRERTQLQLDELRERAGDLQAKNTAIIKQLEAQQLPATESLHELTRSMVAVIGFGIEIAQQKTKAIGRAE